MIRAAAFVASVRGLFALILLIGPVHAGQADVLKVEAFRLNGTWSFNVTVAHADEGWDHYADAWQVVAPDGTVLGTRTLFHPHETEQPFTRSLAGVVIPDGITEVIVRAHDKVHGYGGQELTVTLPK